LTTPSFSVDQALYNIIFLIYSSHKTQDEISNLISSCVL
jgi:hypothetical protein